MELLFAIFFQDVTAAMGAPLTHRANDMTRFLRSEASRTYGWREVSAAEAQDFANQGFLTVAAWYNPQGHPGHVAIVRPEQDGFAFAEHHGPIIANAGGTNFNIGTTLQGFGRHLINTTFHVHDDDYPVS